jgi:hypothetical protein
VSNSEQEWLEEALNGNEDAFTRLVETYQTRYTTFVIACSEKELLLKMPPRKHLARISKSEEI